MTGTTTGTAKREISETRKIANLFLALLPTGISRTDNSHYHACRRRKGAMICGRYEGEI
jgi:hypothetical protein